MPWDHRSSVTQVCRIGYLVVAVSFSARPALCWRMRRCFFSFRLAARRSSFCCRLRGFFAICFIPVGSKPQRKPSSHCARLLKLLQKFRGGFARPLALGILGAAEEVAAATETTLPQFHRPVALRTRLGDRHLRQLLLLWRCR